MNALVGDMFQLRRIATAVVLFLLFQVVGLAAVVVLDDTVDPPVGLALLVGSTIAAFWAATRFVPRGRRTPATVALWLVLGAEVFALFALTAVTLERADVAASADYASEPEMAYDAVEESAKFEPRGELSQQLDELGYVDEPEPLALPMPEPAAPPPPLPSPRPVLDVVREPDIRLDSERERRRELIRERIRQMRLEEEQAISRLRAERTALEERRFALIEEFDLDPGELARPSDWVDPGVPTSRTPLPASWFAAASTTRGDVVERINTALRSQGYDYTVHDTPSGIVVVTRPERFLGGGQSAPGADRFRSPTWVPRDLGADVVGLYYAYRANFRAFHFHVGDAPHVSAEVPAEEATQALMDVQRRGAVPPAAAEVARPFTEGHSVEALIYETVNLAGDVSIAETSALSASEHLRRSGLWAGLEAP